MLSRTFVYLSAAVYMCSAQPLISPSRTLISRDAVTDCQNVTAGFSATCWGLLPRNSSMRSWMDTWNKTTTRCKPGEFWANCFMREANVTTNTFAPIRCDLIGNDICPEPATDAFANISPEMSYGVLAIWGLQQYMTSVYQYIGGDDGASVVKNEFLGQEGPRSAKPILIDILNSLGDPIATNLTTLVTSPGAIGQPTFIIPTETVSPQIVGQTVGYLLQWVMKDWASGGFTTLAAGGNLIEILSN